MPSLASQSRPGSRCAETGSAIARYDGPEAQTRSAPTLPSPALEGEGNLFR